MRWGGDMPYFGILEVYWDDLNIWLEKSEPRIGRIFPDPDSPAVPNVESVLDKTLSNHIPGKMPRTVIGKLAIKTARGN